MLKRLFLTVVFSISISTLFAQTPTQCFVIEDILVDACLTPSSEGENEMLRLRIGPNDLNTANLTANWPNNSYEGVCQNAGTAASVAQLNAAITNGCGHFIEPVNGVLPAGSQVLWFTSEDFEISFHDYSEVNDTVIVIFQCAGNLAGHFANWGTGLRTTTVTFSGTNGCSDSRTYDRALLINQQGGIGGNAAIRDGAGVRWNWVTGDAIYYNDGCVYPASPFEAEILSSPVSACPGDVISLEAYSFNTTEMLWFGGNGTFSVDDTLITEYTVDVNDISPFYLYFQAVNSCRIVTDSVLITPSVSQQLNISANPGLNLCVGEITILSTPSNEPHEWYFDGNLIQGENANSIIVDASGDYHAVILPASGCVEMTDTVSVVFEQTIVANITPSGNINVCEGETITLDAGQGFQNYQWFVDGNSITGETNQTIEVSLSGDYQVLVNAASSCSDTSSAVQIGILAPDSVSIVSPSDLTFCPDDEITLTAASGFASYNWYVNGNEAGVTSGEITLSVSASVYVEAEDQNGCPSTSETIQVEALSLPTVQIAEINGDGGFIACPGDTIIVVASGNFIDSEWFYDENLVGSGDTISLNETGEYTIFVFSQEGCQNSIQFETEHYSVQPIDIFSSEALPICEGETTELSIGTNFTNITWNNDEEQSSITLSSTGTYQVEATDENGCWTSGELDVTVADFPQVDLTSNIQVECVDHVEIVISSDATEFEWTPAEIFQDAQTQNPVVIVPYQGNVSVSASNDAGCVYDAQTIFEWLPCSDVILPNAFAPDGLNNKFKVLGNTSSIASFSLKIFNRWGEIVFSTQNPEEYWDGTYKGVKSPMGTYVWVVEGRYQDGRRIEFNHKVSGNLTLIR